jgi:hypothetical protein
MFCGFNLVCEQKDGAINFWGIAVGRRCRVEYVFDHVWMFFAVYLFILHRLSKIGIWNPVKSRPTREFLTKVFWFKQEICGFVVQIVQTLNPGVLACYCAQIVPTGSHMWFGLLILLAQRPHYGLAAPRIVPQLVKRIFVLSYLSCVATCLTRWR